jgi:hypothetical protein
VIAVLEHLRCALRRHCAARLDLGGERYALIKPFGARSRPYDWCGGNGDQAPELDSWRSRFLYGRSTAIAGPS